MMQLEQRPVLRSILAVLGGYLAMVVGVTTVFSFVVFVVLGGKLGDAGSFRPPGWLLGFELAISAIIAALGGYACAWIARRNEMRHALALAGLMLVMGAVSAVVEFGSKPLWSSVAVTLLGCVAALLGARLRIAHARA